MAFRTREERRERRNRIIISIVLGLIMVMSGFAMYIYNLNGSDGSQGQTIKDGGKEFRIEYNTRTYTTTIDGQDVTFHNLPSLVSDVPLDPAAAQIVKDAPFLVITFNPKTSDYNLLVLDEVRFDLATYTGKPVVNAVTVQDQNYASMPVITCANATTEVPIIFLEEGKEPGIALEGSCIRVIGNTTGFYRARDRLLYSHFGITVQES